MAQHDDGRELVHPNTRKQWRRWLERRHASSTGVWLVQWRSQSGKARVPYDHIVEEALCFGWVDGLTKTLDEERSLLLVTPRRPRSGWARTNQERVERLVRAGLMSEAGLAAVEVAKANGSWTLLDASEAGDADRGDRQARSRERAGARVRPRRVG